MFMAELENRILTSGHDRDAIQGRLVYDLADEGEEYVKINGKKQVLLKNDVILRDDDGARMHALCIRKGAEGGIRTLLPVEISPVSFPFFNHLHWDSTTRAHEIKIK
jgi:hypothetical protein